MSYEWGPGHISNNREEALSLYQGLTQLRKLGIYSSLIFGDLVVVISSMVQNRESSNALLQ